MGTVIWLLVWVLLAVLAGQYAGRSGRDAALWTVLSIFITPLVTFIIIAILDSDEEAPSNSRKCPFCAETIKLAAKICRYCGREVSGSVP